MILQQLGYTKDVTSGLEFNRQEPDREHTCQIVADIAMAKIEMDRLLTNRHPHPELMYSFISDNTL